MKTSGKKQTDAHIRSSLGLEMLVQDVMTTGVLTVNKFDNIMKAARILSERSISGLPVVDKADRVIGVVTQADILSIIGGRKEQTFKDLLRHIIGEPLPERKMGDIVGDIMAASPVTIAPGTPVAEAARIMDEKRIRRLPVVDGQNRLLGIISRADILKAILKKLQSQG